MKKESVFFVLKICIGVYFVFYLGGMFDFLPFFASDLIASEIGFCTMIICAVIAICTNKIINEIRDR